MYHKTIKSTDPVIFEEDDIMARFMDADFLLKSETAKTLYHEHAEVRGEFEE